jgi:eukaryotic-like serine/threonine-protein kinase
MARAPDLANTVLGGRYELIELIGEGTFGRVYRGLDRRLERPVAVKVIKPWWAEDPVWLERFAREARTLARVSHAGIVQIFDVEPAADSPYYVAELIEGGSLADRLRRGPLPPAEAVDIAEQLCRALAEAHSQHVIHRDVKPANILLGAAGRVKVGDFGVARLADGSSHGAAATAIGTPRYMSPEQASGARISAASDVYGVGVVLYEMLAGRPPFLGDSAVEVAVRHLNDPPPPLPAAVPSELEAVVGRALAKDPGERFPDGAAMADALAAIPAGALRSAGPATPPSPAQADATAPTSAMATRVADPATRVAKPAPPPTPHRAGRRRRLVLLAVAAAAVVAGLVAILSSGSSSATVPQLHGLKRSVAVKRAHDKHLRVSVSSRYSDAAKKGTVIAQHPRAGARVDRDSKIRAVVSAGPRPVPVPEVVGRDVADAQRALEDARLRAHVTRKPAPGEQAGTVIAQAPRSTATAPPGSTVELTVVQTPQWRTVTSFKSTGQGDGRSVAFRIRGTRWRLAYDMRYAGNCSFFLVCFGPSADVIRVGAERIDSFDLDEGSGKTHEVTSQPGIYQVTVSAGRDAAGWSMRVQDFY